jgi:zinc protease
LKEREIEKERGVVIEEWRTRLGASDRMMQKTLPKTFYNSRYAKRLPIGQKEILENFPHKELTDFYKDWYRPDLMALVIVGGFCRHGCRRKKHQRDVWRHPSDRKPQTSAQLRSTRPCGNPDRRG